jgi:hypothetical protein
MKNRTTLFAITLLLSFTTFVQAQNNQTIKTEKRQATEFKFLRSIQLEDCKKNEKVIITIAKHTKEFKLMIETSVSSGKLTIEIYDSNDKRQGNFSVGNQLGFENSEHAQGWINKSLTAPEAGEWTVKITPTNAKGIILINTLTLL